MHFCESKILQHLGYVCFTLNFDSGCDVNLL